MFKGVLRSVYFNKYYSGDQIKNNYLRGVWGTHGGIRELYTGFGGETGEKETTKETQA